MPRWTPSSPFPEISTPTFTPSPTPIPTLTLTSTPLPTWTPLPTLEPTTAMLYVENLLQNNAGCQLPCWWGLTPGETTLAEALHFLERFPSFYGINGDLNDYQVAGLQIPYPEDMGTISYVFRFRDGILEDISDIYYGNLTTSNNLLEMLNTYGQPDDILVSAYYEPRYSDYMAVIVLFYLQKGILVRYYGDSGGIIGDKILRCPQKATYPWLNLWAPSLNLTLDEAAKRYLDTMNWPTYRTLEDATGMSVETFYKTFKDVNNTTCLELSTADWPNP